MFVKEIILRGFKTYKDVTSVKLDSGVNCIVGLNGSGKSNLLTAIEFLTVDSSALRLQKKAYLHEGATHAVLNASVELVLDNSDRSLVTFEQKEVRLGRRISSGVGKQDEYVLDGRAVPKAEFMAVLESAGFSKTNPYYIVRQGQVADMIDKDDEARLRLLKSIAGTKAYDDKRAEALKTLEDTNAKYSTVAQTLESIQRRMSKLQSQQAELVEWRNLDLRRRCLARVQAERRLADAESGHASAVSKMSQLETEITATAASLDADKAEQGSLAEKLESLKESVRSSEADKSRTTDACRDARAVLKKTEAELADAKEYSARKAVKESELKLDIERMMTKMEALKAEVESDEPESRLKEKEAAALASRLATLQQEKCHLASKVTRSATYNSVEERNKALAKRVRQWQKEKAAQEAELSRLRAEEDAYRVERDGLVASRSELDDRHKRLIVELEVAKTDYSEVNARRIACERAVAPLERDVKDSCADCRGQENEVREATRKAQNSLNYQSARGRNVADDFVKREGLEDHVFGPIAELITVEPELEVAVEVAGGTQLSNYVVSDLKVGSLIQDEVMRARIGRIQIVPLKQCAERLRKRPPPSTGELLMKYIHCAREVQPAVEQVFGTYVVVRNVDEARGLKREGYDAITVDGDVIDRKGILSGGTTTRKSRIGAFAAQRKARDKLTATTRNLVQAENALEHAKENLRGAEAELSAALGVRKATQDALDSVGIEIKGVDSRLAAIDQQAVRREARVNASVLLLGKCDPEIATLTREMASKQLNELSADELARMDAIEAELPRLESALKTLRSESARHKAKLDKEMVEIVNIQDTVDELKRSVAESSVEVTPAEGIEDLALEVDAAAARLSELESAAAADEARFKAAKASLLQANKRARALEAAVSDAAIAFAELQARVTSQSELVQSSSAKVDTLREEMAHLPADNAVVEFLDRYRGMSPVELDKEAAGQAKLSEEFRGINQKAADQYVAFAHQLSDLNQRRAELEASRQAIWDLVESLDSKKDAVLLRTFENVNMQFGKVFKSIVPSGDARLSLKRMSDDEFHAWREERNETTLALPSGDTFDIQTQPQFESKVDLYTGIGISVAFNAAIETLAPLRQLSGGQRTVAAVALILGIQRCDPGPFYLFDEVDAALDDRYRAAIARLVREGAADAQFIITTFRKELLTAGDKFLHVTLQNKCSHVAEVSREVAEVVVSRPEALEG